MTFSKETKRKKCILLAAQAVEKLLEIRSKVEDAEELRVQRVLVDYAYEYETNEKILETSLKNFFMLQTENFVSSIQKLENYPADFEEFFDLKSQKDSLIDTVLPLFAQIVANAAKSELIRNGVKFETRQKSTPSDWLDSTDDSTLGEIVFTIGTSEIAMGFLREYPLWMQRAIEELLRDSFSQDYWSEVNQTTLDDIERIIREGTIAGKSIHDISKELRNTIASAAYALNRARVIARTEINGVLNAARSMSMDALIEQAGPDALLKKQWRSVLGATTRDTHANLDGVPADENNRWYLGGVYCRWPGDFLLPAGERCNCQCTLVMAFGLSEEDTRKLIEEYAQRLASKDYGSDQKRKNRDVDFSLHP